MWGSEDDLQESVSPSFTLLRRVSLVSRLCCVLLDSWIRELGPYSQRYPGYT